MSVGAKESTVVISIDVFDSFSHLPKKIHPKVKEFIRKFRKNPAHPGIHYEKIRGAKDANLRSVRVDQAYRGIVLRPENTDTYWLLWVDHHDKAYEWALRRTCLIHPETGGLQVIEAQAVLDFQENPPTDVPTPQEGDLFAEVRERILTNLGVPEVLLPLVRSLKTETDLDQASPYLPPEVGDALYMLAAGMTPEQTFQELEKPIDPTRIDTSDFEQALANPDTRRRFYVVEDEWVLEAILNAPLEKWRVFLHPSQRKLVERTWNGPVRVLGGAGTGKTVVAMHRARWLAKHFCASDSDRILFTTFTRNLAADIRENLGKICKAELMGRIEVVNLDKWIFDFLLRRGYRYEIDYGRHTGTLWAAAMKKAPANAGLHTSFFRDEWERVIQPQDITTFEQYIKTTRIGRGVRLSRSDRQAIWPVFEEYRSLLEENGIREPDDAMRDARSLLEGRENDLPYRAIVVDEAQDMGPQAFKLLRSMIRGDGSKNDLFIVGDAHQRIYRHKVVLSQCGVNIRGRSRKLRVNYRTTEETRRWAGKLLEGVQVDDLDGGMDDQKGYRSLLHGEAPIVRRFEAFDEEVEFIAGYLEAARKQGDSLSSICLVARAKELLGKYENALNEKGCPTWRIRRSEGDDRSKEGLRTATMHRVKGLEFLRVIVAGVNDGIVPDPAAGNDSPDPAIRTEAEARERALLFVAATRARHDVVITSFGRPSRFLDEFQDGG